MSDHPDIHMPEGHHEPAHQTAVTWEGLVQLLQAAAGGSAAAQPTTAPTHAKSEKTPDVAVYDGLGGSEPLDRFEAALKAKFKINADRFPMADARVNYAYGRLKGRAAEHCLVGFDQGTYADYTDVLAALREALGDPDPSYTYSIKLLALKQANRAFADHLYDFRALARRSGFVDQPKALRELLRASISRELTAQLAIIDVRHMDLDTFASECLRQDALLRSAAARAAASKPKPWTKPSATTTTTTSTTTAAAAPRPTPAVVARGDGSPMEIDTRRTEMLRRRSQGLCFSCGQGNHMAKDCPAGPVKLRVIANILADTQSAALENNPMSLYDDDSDSDNDDDPVVADASEN